jgi:uncharacterized protein YkwD
MMRSAARRAERLRANVWVSGALVGLVALLWLAGSTWLLGGRPLVWLDRHGGETMGAAAGRSGVTPRAAVHVTEPGAQALPRMPRMADAGDAFTGIGAALADLADLAAQSTALAAEPGLSPPESAFAVATNADRVRYGLAPLAIDAQLAGIARWRSVDMAGRNYFSHDIDGYDVFQVLREQGVTYHVAGENLAYDYAAPDVAVAQAERALMASPTHRANILRAEYTHLGVGVEVAPDGKVLFTQLFKQAW